MHPEPVKRARGIPEEVAAIRAALRAFLKQVDADGNPIGSYKNGVYAFYDYDNEPIYVGQTEEKLSGRIGRHLTNQRTDAVAMNVLDPFEVAFIEVWPVREVDFHGFEGGIKAFLDALEFTIFQKVLSESQLGAVLNEKPPFVNPEVSPPPSHKGKIIPDEIFAARSHPDIRIARRAQTIANLARVISEREVSGGLRITLLTQARRLELLANQRLRELGIQAGRTKPEIG
jgi:hypothetical protein